MNIFSFHRLTIQLVENIEGVSSHYLIVSQNTVEKLFIVKDEHIRVFIYKQNSDAAVRCRRSPQRCADAMRSTGKEYLGTDCTLYVIGKIQIGRKLS